jgi:Kef-type K+ transport system membrane component KefB
MDDAVAWAALALILAGLNHDPRIAIAAIGGGILLVVVLFTLARPLLRALAEHGRAGGPKERSALAWTLVLLLLSAWLTDTIHLYAVFGAFLLGAAFPRGAFSQRLQALIEPVTTTLFLPLFFVYSGLNTRLDLVNSPALWLVVAAMLAAAVLGKGGACYAAARLSGESHSDALGIGILMNARALMELIILNIGLEHGLVTPTLFSILIIMAVITTLMTAPLFNRFCPVPNRVRASAG